MNQTIPALHPSNRDFAWRDREGPRRLLSTAQVRSFDVDGYVVLEDVIEPDTIAAVIAEIDPVEHTVEQLVRDAGGSAFIARADEITFTTHLAAQSSVLRSFVAGSLFCDLTADLIGPDVRLYWDQAVYKKPGTNDPFPWHQDNGYAFVEPQQYLTCWIALTDATEENGCPWIVPGLHRHGTFVHRYTELGLVCLDDAPAAVPAPVRAGGMVAFSSLAPHSTGPNHTSGTRKAYIVQFAPDGAAVVTGDGAAQTRSACTDPDRQFPILVGGAPAGT